MNYFDGLYALSEIAIHSNIPEGEIMKLSRFMNNKKVERIENDFPQLAKFIPYCDWYIIQGQNVLCIPAYIYDTYYATGLLPSLNNYDINPDTSKLEHWEYINPIMFQIHPETGFDFAKGFYPDCNLWNLFLSGCARMNYYEGKEVTLEQRIKYAIVEYMVRRPQFFTTEDFVENEILHRKYNKEKRDDFSRKV